MDRMSRERILSTSFLIAGINCRPHCSHRGLCYSSRGSDVTRIWKPVLYMSAIRRPVRNVREIRCKTLPITSLFTAMLGIFHPVIQARKDVTLSFVLLMKPIVLIHGVTKQRLKTVKSVMTRFRILSENPVEENGVSEESGSIDDETSAEEGEEYLMKGVDEGASGISDRTILSETEGSKEYTRFNFLVASL